jgi:mono/diheme cytochrome c family protein
MNTFRTKLTIGAIGAFLLASTGMFAAVIAAALSGGTAVATPPATPAAATARAATPKDDAPSAAAPAGGRDAELAAAAKNSALVKQGKEAYASFCKSCHGEEKGQSSEAPSNLFDAKWYHGAKPSEIEHTMLKGVAEKGMPGWGEVLPAEDTTALTAYLLSFQKS